MVMRGSAKHARSTIEVSLALFEWDRSVIATLRHATLPWFDVDAALLRGNLTMDAVSLSALRDGIGSRDRLSLLAQFAAHHALLQFAGIADGELDPGEWVVIQRRGIDCRLVRVGGSARLRSG